MDGSNQWVRRWCRRAAMLSGAESPLLVRKRGNLTFKPMQSLKAAFANKRAVEGALMVP